MELQSTMSEKKRGTYSVDDFDQIDESEIQSMAVAAGGKKNAFKRLLTIAQEYKDADCTPVFIIVKDGGEEGSILACVAKETFGRMLN